jgi:two-component system, NtrC family, response regulator PilR
LQIFNEIREKYYPMEMPTNPYKILIIDDDLSMRELLEYMLSQEGYTVVCAQNGKDGIAMLENENYDLLLCDIRLGDITGLDVLRASKIKNPETVVIMISAYSSAETAVEAMNLGAYDYVPKPFNTEELQETIAKALELKTLDQEKMNLDNELKKTIHFGKACGKQSQDDLHLQHDLAVGKNPDQCLDYGRKRNRKRIDCPCRT